MLRSIFLTLFVKGLADYDAPYHKIESPFDFLMDINSLLLADDYLAVVTRLKVLLPSTGASFIYTAMSEFLPAAVSCCEHILSAPQDRLPVSQVKSLLSEDLLRVVFNDDELLNLYFSFGDLQNQDPEVLKSFLAPKSFWQGSSSIDHMLAEL